MSSPQPGQVYDDPGRGFAEDPFPEQDANILLGAAGMIDEFVGLELYTPVVEAVIEALHALLGDAGAAHGIAVAWGAAQTPLLEMSSDLYSALTNVEMYWQGSAMEAFNMHTTRMCAAVEATAGKFAEIGTTLSETVALVYKTHGDVVGFFGEAAAVCLGFFNPFTWPDAIANMSTMVTNAIKEATVTMGEYRANLIRLGIAADGFPIPAELAQGVADPRNWEVQPRSADQPELA